MATTLVHFFAERSPDPNFFARGANLRLPVRKGASWMNFGLQPSKGKSRES
jgi:hypothetical protein